MKLKSVAKASLVDVVAEQIRETVERNRMSAGDRLPSEPELVAQLGVSRTVLREAISRLQCIGLVTVKRGLGTYVADSDDLSGCLKVIRTAMTISSKELVRFVEFREAIECYAARRATELAGDEDLAEMEDLCCQMHRKRQDSRVIAGDLRFHLKLVEITGNPLLTQVMRIIQDLVLEGILRTKLKPWQGPASVRSHRAIVEAIRARDAEAAETAIRAHMNLLVRRLQEKHRRRRPEGNGASRADSEST
jgi:GntR family transcriptional repressor for pyruvate dehydrogenase complex